MRRLAVAVVRESVSRAPRTTSVVWVLLVFVAPACGGKIDEPAGMSAPATGTNTPQNAPPGDGCERSCERMATCTSTTEDRSSCVSACRRDLTDAAAARSFADCLDALSCAELERGLSMDYGPIGECSTKAHRR